MTAWHNREGREFGEGQVDQHGDLNVRKQGLGWEGKGIGAFSLEKSVGECYYAAGEGQLFFVSKDRQTQGTNEIEEVLHESRFAERLRTCHHACVSWGLSNVNYTRKSELGKITK